MGGGPRLVESRGPSLPSPEARDEGQPGRVPTKGFPIGTRSDGVPKPASWGAPGLPVRARPHSRPGAEAPLPRGSGEIRLELGIGSVPEAVRGREAVVLGRRPSSDLESSEAAGPQAGLVEGELEVYRRPSATWTEPSVTSSPPRGASGKAPVWASPSARRRAGAGIPSASAPG